MRNSYSRKKQREREPFRIPKAVQDALPVRRVYDDGIFEVGKNLYSKTWRFTDINYAPAGPEDKKSMFLKYEGLLNSFDSAATTKLTVSEHRVDRESMEKEIFLPMKNDGLDRYLIEKNDNRLSES